MLEFFSASTRMVNTRRGVAECLEASMGSDYASADLIIIHASIGHDFSELISTAKQLAPNARILAASCCGVVGKEGVSESMKDIAIMAIKGKDFSIAHTSNISGFNSLDQCKKMATDLKNQNPNINMFYFLGSGIDIANDRCIEGIESVFGDSITIFGATSSDNMKGFISFQAVDNEVFEHGAYLVGFSDPSLSVETQATHGFVAVGEPMIVTKSTGHIIHELDGKPAWDAYLKRLGLASDATCGDSIPVGALAEKLSPIEAEEYGNQHILRVVTKHEGNDMFYATECPIGTELWLTVRDEELIFSEMDAMVSQLKSRIKQGKTVAVFHADCLARGRFLFNKIMKEELVSRMQYPFYENNECPAWLGMYGFGEFARLGGKNTYHNYTTALYVITRN